MVGCHRRDQMQDLENWCEVIIAEHDGGKTTLDDHSQFDLR